MAKDDPPRSRAARRAAEDALVRVVHHYGETPEFVLLGGLVPELLCSEAGVIHAGTTDVDVQVNLEIAAGATNMARLEQALGNAEFTPDPQRIWRWQTDVDGQKAVVKFELLADLDYAPGGSVVSFDEFEELGAVNLRGTGFAARDFSPRAMRARIGGISYHVDVNVTGLAGVSGLSRDEGVYAQVRGGVLAFAAYYLTVVWEPTGIAIVTSSMALKGCDRL